MELEYVDQIVSWTQYKAQHVEKYKTLILNLIATNSLKYGI